VTSELRYILDANVFIEACKRYYAFDLCPGFWQSVHHYGTQGTLATIDRVEAQLQEGPLLDRWKAEVSDGFFLPTDTDETIMAYRDVIRWAQSQPRLTSAAKAAFASDVDAWLLACAKARGLTMVTHEQPAPHSRNSVKIPDVCVAFGITYVNTFDMLRDLGISYSWQPPLSRT